MKTVISIIAVIVLIGVCYQLSPKQRAIRLVHQQALAEGRKSFTKPQAIRTLDGEIQVDFLSEGEDAHLMPFFAKVTNGKVEHIWAAY